MLEVYHRMFIGVVKRLIWILTLRMRLGLYCMLRLVADKHTGGMMERP